MTTRQRMNPNIQPKLKLSTPSINKDEWLRWLKLMIQNPLCRRNGLVCGLWQNKEIDRLVVNVLQVHDMIGAMFSCRGMWVVHFQNTGSSWSFHSIHDTWMATSAHEASERGPPCLVKANSVILNHEHLNVTSGCISLCDCTTIVSYRSDFIDTVGSDGDTRSWPCVTSFPVDDTASLMYPVFSMSGAFMMMMVY
jgi:hypothetical protein